MLKLIKLELKKNKIGESIISSVKASAIISIIFLISIYFTLKTGDRSILNDLDAIVNLVVRCVFTIFASVLIAHYVIDEYNNKTINVMFMYPIKRRNIMMAKFIIIFIFIFTSMIVSNLFVRCVLYVFSTFTNYFDSRLVLYSSFNSFMNVIINSVLYSFLSFIPLFIGMIKKKTSSVIVTGIIITSVLNSGNDNFSLGSFTIIPYILALMGILSAYIFIKYAENRDVIN